jgi:hypothetical protein
MVWLSIRRIAVMAMISGLQVIEQVSRISHLDRLISLAVTIKIDKTVTTVFAVHLMPTIFASSKFRHHLSSTLHTMGVIIS